MRIQIIDIDYFLKDNKPIIRIFGKRENGSSVICFYEGFRPYFYIEHSKEKINNLLKNSPYRIITTAIVKKKVGIGYETKPRNMVKITLENPKHVPNLKEFLTKHGVKNIYEADIMFKYRFMIDFGIYGMDWIEFSGQKMSTTITQPNIPTYRITEIKRTTITKNTPLKFLSFDIECYVTNPQQPINPKTDQIIIISLAFYPKYKNYDNIVLVAKPFSYKNVLGFQNEEEMLKFFLKLIQEYDPDIITGYNINGFDLPYIIDRLKTHNIPPFMGRTTDKPLFVKTLGYKKVGVVPGRVVVDPYQIIKEDPYLRFSRYNLNTVAKEMLGETKIDVAYKDINELWNGSRENLKKLVEYARKDSILALRLLLEKGLMDKFYELSKVSGTLLQDTLGGQAIRVETMILHEFVKRDMVMPCKPGENEIKKRIREREKSGLKGAVVLEPKKGLYAAGCTLVLDFKSLYPSLIRTYNISPDSFITTEKPEKTLKTPTGAKFVDPSIYKGVMPELLRKMMEARSHVKKQMKKATGEFRKILDARQIALKLLSNSFYGYTGFLQARLYVLDVANAITSLGRENIIRTKKEIEKKFKQVRVLYGDTDSLMLETKLDDLEQAKSLGEHIASYITNTLPGCLELEFEKIYKTFLILSKKRYAGWKFEPTGDKWFDEIEMKGIETVRRDWCPLVSESMNKVLEIILKEGNIKKAINYVRTILEDLKNEKISIEKLTIVKGITKSLDKYDGVLPHIEVAKKISKRNPQQPVVVGERIGYVIVRGNQMLSKRAEDPDYVRRRKLKLDAEYYMKNQILPPLERIFSSINISKDVLLGIGKQVSFFDILKKRKNPKTKTLEGVEEFVCEKCHKSYETIPLRGVCTCGGKLLISFNGNIGSRCRTNEVL